MDIENKNKCIICGEQADAKGSHIVPASLIKKCIGKRDYEESYEIDLINNARNLFLGKSNFKEPEYFSLKNATNSINHHYVLDNILCNKCEKKLGEVEGKIYSEIICKIRDENFKQNFETKTINNFEVLIPKTKRISIDEYNIYFYSIILISYCFIDKNKKKQKISIETINLISMMLKHLMYNSEDKFSKLNTGLIVYLTNNPKMFPNFIETNIFYYYTVISCEFYIILEEIYDLSNPFKNGMNSIKDNEFKIIKNTELLDKEFSIEHFVK
jgi:hypothetical protein